MKIILRTAAIFIGILFLLFALAVLHSLTTFGWKTYTNTELGYSFRHPWTLEVGKIDWGDNYDHLYRVGGGRNIINIVRKNKVEEPDYIKNWEFAFTSKKNIAGRTAYIIDDYDYWGEYVIILEEEKYVYDISIFYTLIPFIEKLEAQLIASTIVTIAEENK
jgi:hypothetical protein